MDVLGRQRPRRHGGDAAVLGELLMVDRHQLLAALGLKPGSVTRVEQPALSEIFDRLWPAYSKRLEFPKVEERLFRRHMLPLLGQKNEGDLLPEHIEEMMGTLKAKLGPETINKVRNAGRRLIERARDNHLWHSPNPFTAVEPLPVPERQYDTLSVAEAFDVLAETEPEWRAFFALHIYLGPRPGEACALEKPDVDLKRATISFCKSHERPTTKTGKIRTRIPIPDELVPYLEEAMRSSTERWVFPGPNGGRIPRGFKFTRKLRVFLARLGIVDGWTHKCRRKGCGHKERHSDNRPRRCPTCKMRLLPVPVPRKLRFYDLRHTSATLHEEAGCHPRVITAVLGHADRGTTRRYIHAQEKFVRAELNKMSLAPQQEEENGKRKTGIEPATPSLGSSRPQRRAEAGPLAAGGPLLTVDEVAALLKLNRKTVYRFAAERRLGSCRVGSSLRFRLDQVADFVKG